MIHPVEIAFDQAILLDRQGEESAHRKIRESIESRDDNRVTDLHFWSIGPKVYGAILSNATELRGIPARDLMTLMMPTFHDRAEDLVEHTGARMTRQRVEVLAVLLAARRALTHHEIEGRVNRGAGMDRVTVYRVLEWLTSHHLAHKIAGDDRIWRFNAASDEPERSHSHAHFKCNDCGEVICLDEATAARSVPLPSGYHPQEIELTVKGLCVGCAPAAQRRSRAHAQHRH